MWSVEREKGHTYKTSQEIINEPAIHASLENTKAQAKDPSAIAAILEAASDRSFLTNFTPGERLAFHPGLGFRGRGPWLELNPEERG